MKEQLKNIEFVDTKGKSVGNIKGLTEFGGKLYVLTDKGVFVGGSNVLTKLTNLLSLDKLTDNKDI